MRPDIWMRPSAIEVAQKVQRHVVFSEINPPAIGPTAGPSKGARL